MVERVARALIEAMRERDDGCSLRELRGGRAEAAGVPDGDFYVDGYFTPADLARAAIAAMREPTAEVIAAGSSAVCADEPTHDVWTAMIAAALEETK